MQTPELQHFYISEEQSIYLLAANDARKHRAWIRLCKQQLSKLGYEEFELVGKGAYGFVFAGVNAQGQAHVFKFSRLTLPQHVQDRLEEEAFMLSQVIHPNVPPAIKFQHVGKQGILVMARAPGEDLEQLCLRIGALPVAIVMNIARQLAAILKYLHNGRPLIHGDIKPSNLVYDLQSQHLSLIDWGSAVFAQRDNDGNPVNGNVMDLMSSDHQHTNARMGDVYFIGEEQLNGALSSPRFDEQGVAATLYALASGQASRFGSKVIPATSIGLPVELAKTLDGMLSEDPIQRKKAGDYFVKSMAHSHRMHLPEINTGPLIAEIPVWVLASNKEVETVSYSSRKAFLKEHNADDPIAKMDDLQLEKYYRNFMAGMGDTEKGFIAAVGRLAQYDIVGGLAIHWRENGVFIDSNLALYNESQKKALTISVNNMVTLACGIHRIGVFKACFFNARDTLHIEREDSQQPFIMACEQQLPFEVGDVPSLEDRSRLHSYFEDGRDPEENLELPKEIMTELAIINQIHHTGCIIFEALPNHMKIHSYLRLLNPRKQAAFRGCLDRILSHVDKIQGKGVSGFMKLPYKNTRKFNHVERKPDLFYPRNPKQG
ncbi:serine/threonine protein kinase [Shewanella sp. Choline-02u-19]|uniref:serine/threonine protein kinase n=1 Tax=unclassified Shewanella TaxID=196818 RepID=UPI000C32B26A|nr:MULTISPECIES: protein kinase [unclassified Shewanella]PKG55267.1 serine/threonine protein kinase [Shewanella sp. GutDb-MelDb]PKG73609.1 serine/threonine protein kinase [Shewanella sp. GutCb]PKH55624.1 serine/threonine protein kinase [Shewanella sp. Bg11-22]PKI29902.1 serine/threonine protein kinase [Shewanella sp. Choline-02u-19]